MFEEGPARTQPTTVVWFKRDLRVADHRPLAEAARAGAVVALYVYESDLIEQPESDPSHYVFLDACLAELEVDLAALGVRLTYRHGTMPGVLEALYAELGGFATLLAHEETGGEISYARDKRVAAWCGARGVAWREIPQFGVIRPLRSRDGWAKRWDRRMLEPLTPAPRSIAGRELPHEHRRTLAELGLPERAKPEAKLGGSRHAHAELDTFLAVRGVGYRKDMSSPVSAWDGCSRLSPYLAFGTIAMREVYQRTLAREAELEAICAEGGDVDPRWAGSLTSFRGRLHWHDHFMQKLEDQPSLEFVNQARAYDGLRENDFDEARFAAWCAGRTGYPMVDACMRALHLGGWINFRMRAMLMSFASYHLWLHWRRTGAYLASQFLDFEPGIHWPQTQMQSGVTGINSIRIYSPGKQARDQDPTGLLSGATCPNSRTCPMPISRSPTSCRRSWRRASAFAAASIIPSRSSTRPKR